MALKICMPDYANSILGVPNSILKSYGINPKNNTIESLDKILDKKYKNIVLMIFDGMGTEIIEKHLGHKSFMLKNKLQDISSVFPCTTAAATTSIYSALYPKEHGWIAWQCYFKEFNQHIELFKNRDYYTKENIEGLDIYKDKLKYRHINQIIEEEMKGNVSVYELFPSFKPNGHADIESLFNHIKSICSNKKENFILSYWDDPDSTMHKEGCFNNNIEKILMNINTELEKLSNQVDDTVFIITADHGHIDVEENIFLNEIKELDECLELAPSMEKRTISFYIKSDKKDVFESRFNNRFKDDFLLFSGVNYINKFLGDGVPHERISDFVGDFVAIAINNKSIMYKTPDTKDVIIYKGLHAGLSSQEMIVPLIVIERK